MNWVFPSLSRASQFISNAKTEVESYDSIRQLLCRSDILVLLEIRFSFRTATLRQWRMVFELEEVGMPFMEIKVMER